MTGEAETPEGALLRAGITAHRQNELAEARVLYQQALLLRPDFFEALHWLGVLELQSNNHPAAADLLARAIQHRPQSAEALHDYGSALLQLGRTDLARQAYDSSIKCRPNFAEAFYDRGNALFDLKLYEAAIASYERAAAIKPDYAEAHYNRGTALVAVGRQDLALTSYDTALSIKPDHFEAHYNRGIILQDRMDLSAALESYNAAIAINPAIAEPHLRKASLLLSSGQYEMGWPEYEWNIRQSLGSVAGRVVVHAPVWRGQEALAGKTILVRCEHGLGDTIQFCRYARLLADMGATVILSVQPSLELLLRDVEGTARVIVMGSPVPNVDYQCHSIALPAALKTTLDSIPSAGRSVRCDPQIRAAWEMRLGEKTLPRVGLAWSGNQATDTVPTVARRSVPLDVLLRHLPAGFQYYCLQRDVEDADRAAIAAFPGFLHFPDDRSFPATAALCDLMDVVLTIDTSIAHLSCALNKPTWILLPFQCEWRWLLNRQDSPWYPSARLFRQARPGDWAGVLLGVRDALGVGLNL